MSPAPADQVNAKELAGRSATVERTLELRQLERLAEAGALRGTRVHALLRFAAFEGRPTIELQVAGVVKLQCQRCLQACATDVDESGLLIVVADDEAEVPGGCEPCIADAEQLSLTAVIEEQVLLGLPLAPMHEDGRLCGRSASGRVVAEVEAAAQPEEKQTPFANLRELLDEGSDRD